jgi:protein gp37
MSDNSAIEWTDASWSPIVGCTMVSEGCRNCYAVTMTRRLAAMGQAKYAGLVNPGKGHFNGVVRLHEPSLELPLRWRKPRRIFVNPMSDLFHERLPDGAIDRIFAVMALCPQHVFQVLTKRPERMQQYLSAGNRRALVQEGVERIRPSRAPRHWYHIADSALAVNPWPLPQVWVGVSVEDQAAADERIPLLLETPAAVWFLSVEPLLGPIDLNLWRQGHFNGERALHWVIAGGESGPGARPMDPSWARSIRDQCLEADVPCFVKQMGSRWPGRQGRDFKGGDIDSFPEDLRVREMPNAYS